MKVSQQLVEALVEAGVKRIYAITGDSLNAVNDAVRENGKIQWIHVRHEETGAFAAGAEAQVSGNLACCAGSSGPGHVHLVNGLYDCQRSYAPVLAIASTCASNEFGLQYFQETNTIKLFADCSGYNELADTPAQAERMLHESMQTAVMENCVAVYGLPGDVADLEATTGGASTHVNKSSDISVPSDEDVQDVADILNSSDRVTLYCGSGVRYAHDEMIRLSKLLNAPVVSTAKGVMDVLYDCPNGMGCSGGVGPEGGWTAVHCCEVLVMLGNDFPFDFFLPQDKRVIQVDIRPDHIGRRLPVEKGVCADMKPFLTKLLPLIKQKSSSEWLDVSRKVYEDSMAKTRKKAEDPGTENQIAPEYVTSLVNKLAKEDAMFTVDTGLNVFWSARYLTPYKDRVMIGSYNHGSMANAMPQAMGLQLAYPDRQVIGLCGDGGITMLMGDLLTIIQYKIPVKLVVYDNRSLGYVQMEMIQDKIPVWQTDLDNPDLGKVASDMGFLGITVHKPEEVEDALRKAFDYPGPALVDIHTIHRDLPLTPDFATSGPSCGAFPVSSKTAQTIKKS